MLWEAICLWVQDLCFPEQRLTLAMSSEKKGGAKSSLTSRPRPRASWPRPAVSRSAAPRRISSISIETCKTSNKALPENSSSPAPSTAGRSSTYRTGRSCRSSSVRRLSNAVRWKRRSCAEALSQFAHATRFPEMSLKFPSEIHHWQPLRPLCRRAMPDPEGFHIAMSFFLGKQATPARQNILRAGIVIGLTE